MALVMLQTTYQFWQFIVVVATMSGSALWEGMCPKVLRS